METKELIALPKLEDLIQDSEANKFDNALMVLLNQEPPKNWIKKHPMTKGDYLPIERVEYLLSRIFTKWWVQVKEVQCIANSVVVTVTLYVINPINGETLCNDGIGASPIQTNSGAGAMDWNQAKAAGVTMAAPSAESYAIKDAAEKFGKLFGKDLNRKELIDYNTLFKQTKWTQE